MSEQLGLDQLAGNCRHVDSDEGTVATLAVFVQRASDELLAGARLAGNHHRKIGLSEAGKHAIDVLHCRAATDQRESFMGFARETLSFPPRFGERAADHGDELVQIERLWQIFVSAALGRGDRRHERVLRAHNDDWQIGPELLDARDQVECALIGHQYVGDDEIALPLADPAPQRGGVAGGTRCIAGPR